MVGAVVSEEKMHEFVPLVEREVWKLSTWLCGEFMIGDLESYGLEALWRGLLSYDPDKGDLRRYLAYEVRFGIIDEVRRTHCYVYGCHIKRDGQRMFARVLREQRRQSSEFSREVSLQAAAAHIGVDEALAVRLNILGGGILEDGWRPLHALTPEEQLLKKEQSVFVRKGVRQLPLSVQRFVEAYYFEGASMSCIAARHGVTECAVSLGCKRGRKQLRRWMERQDGCN